MAASRATLAGELLRLGVRPGGMVMVHASLRAVGRVIGGATTVVDALFDAVGPHGTVAAYLDFETFYNEDDDPDAVPVFDPRTARAARSHGALIETLRTWPGALRSAHPDAGVVAIGQRAEWLTAGHPFEYGYGPGTPFARFVEEKGQVLMLGAPLDTITLLHHAEHLARIPDKRVIRYRRKMAGPDGPQWVEFEEFDTTQPPNAALPENSIEQIAKAYLAAGGGVRGPFGAAVAHQFEAVPLVRFAVEWLERFPYPRPA
jgi:aminoglycoside 3-N-acetyltransferase